jgi:hypothetical protein
MTKREQDNHEQKPYEPLPSTVLPLDVALSLMSEDRLKQLLHYMDACEAWYRAKYGKEPPTQEEGE